jgi:hypothetical protein
LQQLINIMVAIEEVLSEKLRKNFSKQLQNALDRNFRMKKTTNIDSTLAGDAKTWKELLVKLGAFEIFAISIQKGATIVTRDVKVESLLIPGVCFQSSEIFKLINPILIKEGWSLRMFA